MSVIASLTGNSDDAKNFTTTAHSYITQWERLATVPGTLPHANLAYNDTGSWG
jgi:hypothetical protein